MQAVINTESYDMAVAVFGPDEARQNFETMLATVADTLDALKSKTDPIPNDIAADNIHKALGPLGLFGAEKLYAAVCELEVHLRSKEHSGDENVQDAVADVLEATKSQLTSIV